MRIAENGNVTIKIVHAIGDEKEGGRNYWRVHAEVDPQTLTRLSDDRKELIKDLDLDESEFPVTRSEAENQAEAIVTLKRNLKDLNDHLIVNEIAVEPDSEVAHILNKDWEIRDIGEMPKSGGEKLA